MLVQRRNKKGRDQGGCPELVHPLPDPRSNSPAVSGPAFYWQLDLGSVLVAQGGPTHIFQLTFEDPLRTPLDIVP